MLRKPTEYEDRNAVQIQQKKHSDSNPVIVAVDTGSKLCFHTMQTVLPLPHHPLQTHTHSSVADHTIALLLLKCIASDPRAEQTPIRRRNGPGYGTTYDQESQQGQQDGYKTLQREAVGSVSDGPRSGQGWKATQ